MCSSSVWPAQLFRSSSATAHAATRPAHTRQVAGDPGNRHIPTTFSSSAAPRPLLLLCFRTIDGEVSNMAHSPAAPTLLFIESRTAGGQGSWMFPSAKGKQRPLVLEAAMVEKVRRRLWRSYHRRLFAGTQTIGATTGYGRATTGNFFSTTICGLAATHVVVLGSDGDFAATVVVLCYYRRSVLLHPPSRSCDLATSASMILLQP